MSSYNIKSRIEDVYLSFLLSYTKFFNGLIRFQMLILSIYVYVFTFQQDLLQNEAYEWALSRFGLGFETYSIVALVALICMSAWFFKSSKSALIVGISCFTWIQMMFGISILVLTLTGSVSAITGTIQWMSIPVINVILLMTSGIPPSSKTD